MVASPYLHCAGLGLRLGHTDDDVLVMLNRILEAADCEVSSVPIADEINQRDNASHDDCPVLAMGELIPFHPAPAQIHLVEDASYIFLEFASRVHSAQALEVLDRSTALDPTFSASGLTMERHLRVSYAEMRSPMLPADGVRCTSRYSTAKPQGLMLRPDFVSVEDEKVLLAAIDSLPWDNTTIARRVQHYGFTFQYGYRSIDFLNKAPPMPECFHDLVSPRITLFKKVLLLRAYLIIDIILFLSRCSILSCLQGSYLLTASQTKLQ